MTPSALRAAARIAWRQARRTLGRSALVVAMIALPIGALTLGATLIRTAVPTLDEYVSGEMGSADIKLGALPAGIDARSLGTGLPKGSRVAVIRQWNRPLIVKGAPVYTSVFEPSIPIDQSPIPGLYELMVGRAPTRPGEVAVDPRVLDVFGVRIGETLAIGKGSFKVVGVAARPLQMWKPLLVVAPGTLPPVSSIDEDVFVNSVLVDLPKGADVGAAQRTLFDSLYRHTQSREGPAITERIKTRNDVAVEFIDDTPTRTGVSFAGTLLALCGTGLIAAAAFAIGIRRQLRALGLVGAAGGEPAHVRAIVLLGGATLGCVGAVLGVLIGLGGAFVATPHLHRLTNVLPGHVSLHWPTIAGAAALGVIAATTTAAWPARLAARVPTLDALAARMPPPRPPGRLARRGMIGVVVGAVLTGATTRPNGNMLALGAGLALMLGGFLTTAPLLVRWAGRLASRLPAVLRLAVRETARHERRTGIAISATAIALMLPVGVAALSLSDEKFQRRTQWIGAEHLLVGTYGADGGKFAAQRAALLVKMRRVLPGARIASPLAADMDLKRYPVPANFQGSTWPAFAFGRMATGERAGGASISYPETGRVFIGGPDLLRALNAEDGIPALRAGKVVAIGPNTTDRGTVRLIRPFGEWNFLESGGGPGPPGILLPAVEAGATRYGSQEMPRYVVSPEHARKIGLLPERASRGVTLVAAREPLTPQQIRKVRNEAALHPGIYISTADDFVRQLDAARLAATGGAALVALLIVGVTISLVGAEARRDQAILAAIGAAPRARRQIAGARAGLAAMLAGVIATPAGSVPIAVIQWSRPERYPIVIPWATIALVTFAIPLVAAVFGGLTSRAPKASAMLQPID